MVEYARYRAVKARFRPWLSGDSSQNFSNRSFFTRKRNAERAGPAPQDLHGYLAHTKLPPPSTISRSYAYATEGSLEEVVSYQRGIPVPPDLYRNTHHLRHSAKPTSKSAPQNSPPDLHCETHPGLHRGLQRALLIQDRTILFDVYKSRGYLSGCPGKRERVLH